MKIKHRNTNIGGTVVAGPAGVCQGCRMKKVLPNSPGAAVRLGKGVAAH